MTEPRPFGQLDAGEPGNEVATEERFFPEICAGNFALMEITRDLHLTGEKVSHSQGLSPITA